MKQQTGILALVATGCGLVAAVLFVNFMGTKPVTEVEIIVAAKEIPAGKIFTDDRQLWEKEYFTKRKVDLSNPWVAEGSTIVKDLDLLKKKKVQRVTRPGEPMFTNDLTANLGLDIPAGMVAVGIRVSAAGVAGGFVLPNSKVDVLVLERNSGRNGGPRSNIVLQDLLVAAVDQNATRQEGQTQLSQTVTLAVTPKEAQMLALAENRGPMTLLLRRPEADPTDRAKQPIPPLDAFDSDTTVTASTPAKEETVEVLIARQDIPREQKIDNVAAYFEVKSFPKSLAPKNRLDAKTLENKTILRPLCEGQLALTSLLESEGVAVPMDVARGSTVPAANPPAPAIFVQKIINGSQAPRIVIFNGDQVQTPKDAPLINNKQNDN